jgi:hypothetical protein
MTTPREVAVRIVAALPSRVQGPVQRAITSVRHRMGRISPRDSYAISLPGSGPVVMLDARGLRGDDVLASIEAETAGEALRVVLLIDDPQVHLYRSAPVSAIEYFPASSVSFSRHAVDDRLTVLQRTYRVERVVPAVPPKATVT